MENNFELIQFGESYPAQTPVSKVFAYEGANMTFVRKDGKVMVNATQMAKKFGKAPKDWLRTNPSKEFIDSLSAVRHICPTDLVKKTQGGNGEQGTWMHEDVAIEFARWLSPAFAIWCNDRIKELLTLGMTATQPTLEAMLDDPDLVIGLATKLKMQREENARLEAENQQKQAVIASQQAKIKSDEPKVAYHDAYMAAPHGERSVGIREVVKQSHIKSEKKFIDWMINRRILFRQHRNHRLQPYAEYTRFFDAIDVYDKTNDWSGKQLLVNPGGKLEIVKKYKKEHPEEFYDQKMLFQELKK